ncbi:MAG: hypothetical protein HC904_08695 [Blastochloris sp.]|nr:hypothetical protein [Blastochloris sp.]
MKPDKVKALGAFEENAVFSSVGVLLDHRQMWMIFQRLLRVSRCDLWPDAWKNFFAQTDISELTRQRHGLHYNLKFWVMDDMHQLNYDESFRKVDSTGQGLSLFDKDNSNYSYVLAFTLVQMALSMMVDLSQETNRLKDEMALILTTFSSDRHPLHTDFLRKRLENPSLVAAA